jgi:glycosyltransferase involved in cell wall biosynthesis
MEIEIKDNASPLVSVGIPAYNRPEGLRQTLECITNQTYRNLEIIVSDNDSPDPQVEQIAREFQQRYPQIHYYKQPVNKGAAHNFLFVLNQAHGKYFMWAADDDKWEPFYIEKLAAELENLGTNFAAANFEAQYVDEDFTRFDFFSEGAPFYNFQSNQATERIKYTLTHNYGNLIYSLYRKEILDRQNLVFVENEIPFLLQIAGQGNWRVLPEIGFYKKTLRPTYRQAHWEMSGGFLPRALRIPIRAISSLTNYHRVALENIIKALNTLDISTKERGSLQQLATKLIWRHWLWLLLGYKPKPF